MSSAMAAVILSLIAAFLVVVVPIQVTSLGGSASTIAVVYSGNVTVCGITSEQRSRGIKCWRGNQVTDVFPGVSFDYLAGGRDVFCGTVAGGLSLLCFDTAFRAKRLYQSQTVRLKDLTVGEGQICALTNGTRNARCWRGGDGIPPTFSNESDRFLSLSSGIGFSCGVLMNSNRVVCRGSDRELANLIEVEFANFSMNNINAGGNFACGLNLAGFIVCRGRNESGQLDIPQNTASRYSSLALGNSHGCAIRQSNGSVVCWGNLGGEEESMRSQIADSISFESIVAGFNFTCGLLSSNLSVICWGTGWPTAGVVLPLGQVLPGPCVQSDCGDCGIYPQSQSLCFNSGNICRACNLRIPPPTPDRDDSVPPRSSPPSQSKGLRKGLLAFAIVGSIGTVSGICTILYCLWIGACCGHNKKIHNSVQPTVAASNSNNGRTSNNNLFSRSSTLRRQGSRIMRRQRSGTSSFKHPERAEEFSFQDLSAATNNFSMENKIGAGSFGVVYRGKLPDGREVAIKRGDTEEQTKKFQEKESAFDSELAFLSRLHHKHLVGLVGYCEERDERLLVYDYMKNGALYDHLHDKDNIQKDSSVLNSWKMRISVSLDAARGIEYLHNYAVPPIIHRDIKSSNILLDSNWTARVSDFGLSLLGPQSDGEFRPIKAAGTVGYIDPEYYGLNVLTAKSDVYGLGIVLLELLTGKRAIFKNAGEPMSVVDFAVPAIVMGEMGSVLDPRVGKPEGIEAEAVELVAYAAVQCVNREGRDRPTMADMVTNLERALGMLDHGSHGSLSSGPVSSID